MQQITKNDFKQRRNIHKPGSKNANKYKKRVQQAPKNTKTGLKKRKKIQKAGSNNVYSMFFLLFALPYIFSFAQLCPPMFFQLLPGLVSSVFAWHCFFQFSLRIAFPFFLPSHVFSALDPYCFFGPSGSEIRCSIGYPVFYLLAGLGGDG